MADCGKKSGREPPDNLGTRRSNKMGGGKKVANRMEKSGPTNHCAIPIGTTTPHRASEPPPPSPAWQPSRPPPNCPSSRSRTQDDILDSMVRFTSKGPRHSNPFRAGPQLAWQRQAPPDRRPGIVQEGLRRHRPPHSPKKFLIPLVGIPRWGY